MTKRYALRDDQWERIEALLPGRAGQGGARRRRTGGLWTPCCPAIAWAFPGGTCPHGLGIFG